tara:strand:- start:68 stop:445 length:378 start_codon:yes stop_codon:yes gene_type:complete
MMIHLRKLGGDISLRAPNLATCFEYVSLWGSASEDAAQLGRICAGALGVCLDYMATFPKYRTSKQSASEYGHIMLDRLLERGVTGSEVYREGVKALQFLATKIPVQEEVEERVNFTSSPDSGIST